MAEAEKEVQPNKFARNVGAIAAMVTLGVTIAALGIGFPVAGAWYLGAMAVHAGGGVLGALGAGAVGLVAGLVPYGLVNAYGSKKDKSYGTLEAMCAPVAVVDEVVNCLLSPRYGLSKLKKAFSRASQQSANVEALPSAPQPPAAKPDSPKQ